MRDGDVPAPHWLPPAVLSTCFLFALVAMVAGIVAAIFPAQRAARLNVLEALQYE